MTETTTVTLPRQTINLNLKSLKTVAWLESNPVVQDVSGFTSRQLTKARQYTVLSWILSIIEFQLVWLYTLLHTVPWPSYVIGIVHRVDEMVESVLEEVFTRLEWWWDYITIRLMRAAETVVVYLDKLITFVDGVICWLVQKFDFAFDLLLRAVGLVKSVYTWYIGLWLAVWDYLSNLVHNAKQMWSVSQEEMLLANKKLRQRKQQQEHHTLLQQLKEHKLQQEQQERQQLISNCDGRSGVGCDVGDGVAGVPCGAGDGHGGEHDGGGGGGCLGSGGGSGSEKKLSFSEDQEDIGHYSDSIGGHRLWGSDSEGSDVMGVHETRKTIVGEQTGQSYSRVHTQAIVVGRQREAMYQRVTAKLKVMRKNSIRFSRGVDVRVSRMIGSVQRQFTPSSLVSLVLSLIKFFLLLPFKVVIWLVGGKGRLSRRSRSMRSESLRRREAAAAAAAAAAAGLPVTPLGPTALLQSAMEDLNRQKVTTLKEEDNEDDRNESPDSVKRDSGLSEDIQDSSEDVSEVLANKSATTIFFHSKNDKYLSLSSNSTISEEPDEDGVSCQTPTPPPTPIKTTSGLSLPGSEGTASSPRQRCTYSSGSLESVRTVPQQAISEPDLRSSILTLGNGQYKRRSLGEIPAQFSPPTKRRVKKRVTIM